MSALNPDESEAAVTIEHGVEIALTQAPRLIFDALSGPIPELFRQHLDEVQREIADAERAPPNNGEANGHPE